MPVRQLSESLINRIAAGESEQAIVERIGKLVQRYQPARAVWVGPPWLGDTWKTATNAMMSPLYEAALQSPLEVFDSRPATKKLAESKPSTPEAKLKLARMLLEDAFAEEIEKA